MSANVFNGAEFPEALDTNRSRNARERLNGHISRGKDYQRKVVEQVSNMVINDTLVTPRTMNFSYDKRLEMTVQDRAPWTVHTHALNQISSVLEYPRLYMGKLQRGVAGISRTQCLTKMVDDLNWHAHNAKLKDRKSQDARYLVRYVDGEIRGFLSRSFKRHLASKPLMSAFLSACQLAELVPMDGHASAVRVNLQCVLPYVFEPFDGEFVAVGVAWSNSDFGGARMKVSMFMQRISGYGTVILNDAVSEVHIGSIIEESDIEMSEETVNAELTAQKSAIKDAVIEQLHPVNVQKLLDLITLAHEEQVPWHKLRAELGRILQKKELDTLKDMLLQREAAEDLPAVKFDDEDDPLANRWWASSAIGVFADKEQDADRKKELQEFAGQMLLKTKPKK